MLPLVLGTILAVGALAYVLFPLLAGTSPRSAPAPRATAQAPEGEAVAALREIEFDRATGKLSDSDYDELKSRYTTRALEAIRAGTAPADDAAEAAVLAYRSRIARCRTCGPRTEPDAVYCSDCGSYLPGSCDSCGAVVKEAGAAFCTSCGRQLAA